MNEQNSTQAQLLEMACRLMATLDAKEVLTRISIEARQLFHASGGAIYRLEADGQTLTPVVALQMPHNADILAAPLEAENSLVRQAIRTGRGLIVNNTAAHSIGDRIPGAPVEAETNVMALPFIAGDQVLGAMRLDRPGNSFTEKELVLAEAFAAFAATALKNAQGHRELERQVEERQRMERALAQRAREMAALYETSLEIQTQPDLSRLLRAIVERATGLLGARMGGLYLLRPDGQTLELVVAHNLPGNFVGTVLRLGEGLSGRVAQTGQPMMIEDYRHWEARARAYDSIPFRLVLGVPLRISDRVLGVINVTDDTPRPPFSPDEIRLVSLFADQAAIAIENARLYQAEREQRELAETLRETGARLATMLDTGSVLDDILQQISRVVPHDAADIMLVEGDRVRVARWRGYERFNAQQFIATFTSTIVDLYDLPKMIATGEPSCIPDTHADPRWKRFAPTQWIRSRVSAPLRVHGRVLGFINVNSATPNQFGQADADRLSVFANQAALALANARLFQAEQEQRDLAETLRDIGATLAATLDAEAVLERLLDQIGSVVPNEMAMIMRVESGLVRCAKCRGSPEHEAYSQLRELTLPLTQVRHLREMFETRQPVVIPDVQTYSDWAQFPGTDWIRSYVSAPIRIKGQVIGFLGLASSTVGFYTAAHAARLQALADQTAIALENARLHQAEREQFRRWQESQAQLIQAEKMAALGRLVGSISHEFNNPLQAVLGALELFREELEGRVRREPLLRYLAVMEKETERIAAIVKRVRDFYRPVHQEKNYADLRVAMDKVIEMTREQLLRYNITAEQDLVTDEGDELPLVRVSPDDLKQILLNLVLNAIDAMETTGGTLRVCARPDHTESPDAEPQPVVRIQVSDTGIGIPPDMLPHVFEPFVTTRADQATPAAPKAALGLSISYGIVQANGGQITVSSQVGAGTTFTLLLPVAQL